MTYIYYIFAFYIVAAIYLGYVMIQINRDNREAKEQLRKLQEEKKAR